MSPQHGLDNASLKELLEISLNPACEQQAWTKIEELIDKPLFGYATMLLSTSSEPADEYVQETKVRFWINRQTLLAYQGGDASLKSWLFTVLRRLISDKVFRRTTMISIQAVSSAIDDQAHRQAPRFINIQAARYVNILTAQECINQLPAGHRRVYELYYGEDLTSPEISERLASEGISLSANMVRRRLVEVRELVSERLEMDQNPKTRRKES
jgi:RNA polymerase sigma factor (sigma-70 family)